MRSHRHPTLSARCQPTFALTCAAWIVLAGTALHGQIHHVSAPEHVTRAVGVYEWTGDLAKPTAARFVPVSLFINGRFEDAGLYLARPVPFALQPGDIYSLEHAGEPGGQIDLDLAHRVVTGKALADDNPLGAWYGFGKFTPVTTPAPPKLKPSAHLAKLESSAGPDTPAGSSPADKQPGDSPDAGTAPPKPVTTADEEVDRPTLRRRDPAQDAARRKEANAKSKTASVTTAGPALGDDPDRPTLSHNTSDTSSTPELTGLPADLQQAVAVSDAGHTDSHAFNRPFESPAERAETLGALDTLARARLAAYLTTNQLVASSAPQPAAGTPLIPAGLASAAGSAAEGAPAAAAKDNDAPTPPKLQRGVPGQYRGSPASPLPSRVPSSAPSGTPKASMKPANRPPSPSSRATHRPTSPLRTSLARPAALTLGQEEIAGFTLSYGGLPTFVYTAAASVTAARSSPAAEAKPTAAYVTLIAQRLPSGELQIALSAVTDNAHLDRGPRLRLIDAVDPDDSHRASLLMELRGATSRQFALYRLASAHAEQIFTSASLE